MFDVETLSVIAEHLLASLHRHQSHPDVAELLRNARFTEILRQAICREVTVPMDLGMGRWLLESNLRDIPEVSTLFSAFYLALKGVKRPVDPLAANARDINHMR